LELKSQNFDTPQLKMCHGLALMGHTNLMGHHNISIIGPIGMI
jgi:hypothetical protein